MAAFVPPRAAHAYVKRWAALFEARAWPALQTIDRAGALREVTMAYLKLLRSSGCHVASWTIKRYKRPRWIRPRELAPTPTLWCDLELVRAKGNPVTIWLALAPYGRGFRQCDYVEQA